MAHKREIPRCWACRKTFKTKEMRRMHNSQCRSIRGGLMGEVRGFTVEITTGAVFLTLDEIWPDSIPENPTEADVKQLIESGGDPYRVATEWGLDLDTQVVVSQVGGRR